MVTYISPERPPFLSSDADNFLKLAPITQRLDTKPFIQNKSIDINMNFNRYFVGGHSVNDAYNKHRNVNKDVVNNTLSMFGGPGVEINSCWLCTSCCDTGTAAEVRQQQFHVRAEETVSGSEATGCLKLKEPHPQRPY